MENPKSLLPPKHPRLHLLSDLNAFQFIEACTGGRAPCNPKGAEAMGALRASKYIQLI